MLLTVATDDPSALGSLYTWLRGSADVTAHAELTPVPATGPTMNVLEAIDVVLSNTIGLTSLIVAVKAWRGAGRRATVTLTAGGITLSATDPDPATLAAMERALRAATATGEHAA
ncbi:effector-associated constant component EACC1 [Dactylosporangium matsuzakiense]|uniref:Uncharacterized protein n=1 Tax=Dactylosporangium matsuzakiense TaxID=53360 RepID=A0A9W6NQ95_9ACTN|nr:hypothetical protein [Dactylosporangium matsuzakiense]UWZ40939.1 hypothetical protein Dmats_24745 [Dactylosporangium matsuzakiense]GLL04857.1 hypothetical protein GCM10017581_066040 [Dactylosporangium matsuzakiense]